MQLLIDVVFRVCSLGGFLRVLQVVFCSVLNCFQKFLSCYRINNLVCIWILRGLILDLNHLPAIRIVNTAYIIVDLQIEGRFVYLDLSEHVLLLQSLLLIRILRIVS